jgi:hypothetical protein
MQVTKAKDGVPTTIRIPKYLLDDVRELIARDPELGFSDIFVMGLARTKRARMSANQRVIQKEAAQVARDLRHTEAPAAKDLRLSSLRAAAQLRAEAVIVARHLKDEAEARRVADNAEYLEELLLEIAEHSEVKHGVQLEIRAQGRHN